MIFFNTQKYTTFKVMKTILAALYFVFILLALAYISTSCRHDVEVICERTYQPVPTNTITKIAFGSCSKETKPQAILDSIALDKPDLFIYLGDNIYGDTRDMSVLKAKYEKLGCKPEFQRLLETCHVMATWDDHDFGENDAGVTYPKKEASKEIFLNFWNEPLNSERRMHDGIYHSHIIGDADHRIQILLLDCRTFRSDLKGSFLGGYNENNDSTATMLGTQQWTWLEEQLRKPAKIRIVCSSTQFSRSYNRWESWANFPLEIERMKALIKNTHANGVVFISGDIHLAELSARNNDGAYPIYDMTSSGLTQLENSNPDNSYRVGALYNSYNYGWIEIDWTNADHTITLSAKNIYRKPVITKTLHLSDISF